LSGGPAGPAALWAASRGVQSERGHKFLLGQFGGQKAMADIIRKYAPGGAAIQQSLDTE
jgi:kynureninase